MLYPNAQYTRLTLNPLRPPCTPHNEFYRSTDVVSSSSDLPDATDARCRPSAAEPSPSTVTVGIPRPAAADLCGRTALRKACDARRAAVCITVIGGAVGRHPAPSIETASAAVGRT